MVSFNVPKQIFDVGGLHISVGAYVLIKKANGGAYGANGSIGTFLGIDAQSNAGRTGGGGYKVKVGDTIWDIGGTPKLKLVTVGDLP